MVKHNNVLPNQHFRKHWQTRIKTWFDQPGRKKSRRVARLKKAEMIAPRPVDGLLRPAVRCPTFRYNMKLRAGKGFTLDELKEAGIRKKEARSIGIAVDHRRRNRCTESLTLNTERLRLYKSKLVVFPKDSKKPKKTDASPSQILEASQLKGAVLPISNKYVPEKARSITEEEKSVKAFATLRDTRALLRYKGIRSKHLKEKAEKSSTEKN